MYLKITIQNYIVGLCTCDFATQCISKKEYENLSAILKEKPESSNEKYQYMLNNDTLEWELIEIESIYPTPEQGDLTVNDTLEMLNELGVDVNDQS